MSESIQIQALRLDWLGDFDDDYARTRSFVKGLIGKPWWHSVKQLLANEGPLGRMAEVCMVYQFEADSRQGGYAAYTKYLTQEYGRTLTRNKKWGVADLNNTVPTVSPSPLEDLAYTKKKLEEIPDYITEEQRDFLTMYGKMGMDQLADLMDIPLRRAWDIRRNIQGKVRYWARKG